MSDSSYLLDPEVEAILQEVARDPDSVLLRVDRPKELRVLLAGGDTVVRSKTGLSKAEKHLLEVHRDEAAYLLRLAYYELAKRLAPQRGKGLLHYSNETEAATLGVDRIRQRLEREQEFYARDPDARAAIGAGLQLLEGRDSRLVDLALASIRLVPSFSARSYVGSELMLTGQLYSAYSTLARLNQENRSPIDSAIVLNKLGMVSALTGRLHEWREAARGAAQIRPAVKHAMDWLSASIQTDHMGQAQDAARLISERWPKPTREAQEWLTAVRQQPRADTRRSCESLRPLLDKLSVGESESTRLVIRSLLEEAE